MQILKSNLLLLPALGLLTSGVFLTGCKTDGLHTKCAPPGAVMDDPGRPARGARLPEHVDIQVAETQEVDLVEALVESRAQYHRHLETLRDYYRARGYVMKEKWAAFELEGLRSVKAFRYLLEAEIPSDALRAGDSIPEADAMFAQGEELMRRGGHNVPVLYRQDMMIRAAATFRDMIERYPTSDKIDDAAFLCGEIHKEYLKDQEVIAVRWYERAWTWDPNTPHPARFQAALVYDYRLHDRTRALELYREVAGNEEGGADARFAIRRIGELTESAKATDTSSRVTRVPRS